MLSDTQRAALAARLRQGRRTGPAPAGTGPVIDLGTAGTVPAYLLHAVGVVRRGKDPGLHAGARSPFEGLGARLVGAHRDHLDALPRV